MGYYLSTVGVVVFFVTEALDDVGLSDDDVRQNQGQNDADEGHGELERAVELFAIFGHDGIRILRFPFN